MKSIYIPLLACCAGLSQIQAQTWTGAVDGAWTNAANWAENSVPGQYYLSDGTRTGSLSDTAIFGDNLTGAKATTISFEGVYSISNLTVRGKSTRYTFGTDAEEYIPIQPWGFFIASEEADTLVPEIACKLRLGVDFLDANYSSENIVIRTENPNETLQIGPWGFRTKANSASAKESRLDLMGRGIIQFNDSCNTGEGGVTYQVQVFMSGGMIIANAPLTLRTFQLNSYKNSTDLTRVYITENGSIRSPGTYNFLGVNTPTRIYGPGWFGVMISYQPTRSDGYGNYPGWFLSDTTIYNTLTLESPLHFIRASDVTDAQLAVFKTRLELEQSGTIYKRGLPGDLVGEVTLYYVAWIKETSKDGKTVTYHPEYRQACTLDVEAMGKTDNSVTGSLGCVDFLMGNDARLRHSGVGEVTDRAISLTGIVANATFEFAGTGTMTLASPVSLRGVSAGKLKLENNSITPVEMACKVGPGVTLDFVSGTWHFANEFSGGQTMRLSGSATWDVDHDLTITNLYADAASKATIFVKEGVTLAITNFTCASGGLVDFQILDSQAKIILQENAIAGTVTVNGMASKVNDDGTLTYDMAATTDYMWKWATSGAWTVADNWINGIPNAQSFIKIIAPGSDYTVKMDGAALAQAGVGDAGAITVTNLVLKNLGEGTATLLVTNGADVTFVARMDKSGDEPLQLGTHAKLEIVDARVTMRDHGTSKGAQSYLSPLQNAGGVVNVRGSGELVVCGREGTAENASGNQNGDISFGTGHYVFRDNAKLHFKSTATTDCGWRNVLYPHFKPSAQGDLKMEFLGNSAYVQDSSLSCWKGELGDNGRHVELIFDTTYESKQDFWSYSYIGRGNGLSEMKLKRGTYRFGNYLVAVASPAMDNGTSSESLYVTGRVEVAENANATVPGYYETRSLMVGNALSFTIGRDKAFVRGEIASCGTFSILRGSLYVGAGACAEGEVRQTGGAFNAMATAESDSQLGEVAIGIFGGKGLYALEGGTFNTRRYVFVGGATTNDLHWGTGSRHKNSAHIVTYHDAQGELCVNGGSFASEKDIILGADGSGWLTLSNTGLVSAVSIIVSNTVGQAASGIRFVATAKGKCGTIAPTTKLVFNPNAEVTVDLTAFAPKARRSLTIWNLEEPPEGLANASLNLIGSNKRSGESGLVLVDNGRKLVWNCGLGTAIIFR